MNKRLLDGDTNEYFWMGDPGTKIWWIWYGNKYIRDFITYKKNMLIILFSDTYEDFNDFVESGHDWS